MPLSEILSRLGCIGGTSLCVGFLFAIYTAIKFVLSLRVHGRQAELTGDVVEREFVDGLGGRGPADSVLSF